MDEGLLMREMERNKEGPSVFALYTCICEETGTESLSYQVRSIINTAIWRIKFYWPKSQRYVYDVSTATPPTE